MKQEICKERIEAAKVVVLGSYNADLVMKIPRFAKPGETLIAGPFTMGSGGKGSNQAVAAAKLGADVSAIVKVGTDVFSNTALELYKEIGIDTKYVARDDSVTTGIAIVLVEDKTAENACIIEQGTNIRLTKEDVDAAEEAFENAGINIEYCYSLVTNKEGRASVAVRVDDNDKATEVLTEKGIKLLSIEDIA